MVGGLWEELLWLPTAPLNTEDAFNLWYAVFWRQKGHLCACTLSTDVVNHTKN